MKMIFVAAGEEFVNSLSYHLKPLGFTLEHYDDPMRVVDQLGQIDPQAILFHGGDFPRHWKPLLKLARQDKPREELIFLLIAPADFQLEDVAKAAFLGVNGIMSENLGDREELYRLEEIVRRYRSLDDKRNFTRLVPRAPDELGFAFTHPRRMALVTGRVREISIQGSSFLPTRSSAVADLNAGSEIKDCSLKIENQIISVTCKVTRNREEMGFQFLTFQEGGHRALLRYIQSRAERELKSVTSATRKTLPV
jgi:hypothetical protein